MVKNKYIWINFNDNLYDDLKNQIIDYTCSKNSLFKKENGKLYFKDVNDKWTPFVIRNTTLIFENDTNVFCKFILEVIKSKMKILSFQYQVEKIKYRSDVSDEFLIKRIEGWLNVLFNCKKLNPIDISCYISFKILIHHYFTNGNKRISIMFLTDILEYFNLFLSYTNMSANPSLFETRWYKIFTEYINKHEKNECTFEELYNQFRSAILNGLFLDARSIK